MNNKIEILRSICFTDIDMQSITNIEDVFTSRDIEFMVEFKKIYELGLSQLKKFIDLLDSHGDELDTYSIEYYVTTLKNGPFGGYISQFSVDKKYFNVSHVDSIGTSGDPSSSTQNISIFEAGEYPLGTSPNTFRKLPPFIQIDLSNSIAITEDIFRSSLKSSTMVDNTLPLSDKNSQLRYDEDLSGEFLKKSNGVYMLKDPYFFNSVSEVFSKIDEKIVEILGEEDYRVYSDNKNYNPFNPNTNTSVSINSKIDKIFEDGGVKKVLSLDLMGDDFDSVDNRKSKLIIDSGPKTKEYLLHTNSGQLGG